MKKLLGLLVGALLLLVAVLLLRTYLHQPQAQQSVQKTELAIDSSAIAERLAAAIQIKTISYAPHIPPGPEFDQFIGWLKQTYPEVFSRLELETLNQYTLLLRWPGRQAELAPVLLSAHYDVVPVIPGSEHLWRQPPFSGVIDDTHIWGRGALDDKSAVIALLEAFTLLLQQGKQPEQTVYLALTHDEEIGSGKGSKAVAEHLQAKGIRLAWSLDEGSFVLNDMIDGMPMPVANINVAEKGYMNVKLSVQGEGGHSSVPPAQTSIGILAEAVARVQNAPLAGGLTGTSAEMFDVLSRHMPFRQRLFFANRWLFGPLLERQMANTPYANAMLRTTTAPTMIEGGIKDNVLPIHTSANINFRLHPRDKPETVLAHINQVVNDERVDIETVIAQPASPEASTKSAGFALLAQVSRSSFGDVIVAPGITVGGTDSKYYQLVAEDSYRFNPMVVGAEDISGFHGNNERISIDNMRLAVIFYQRLLLSLGSQH
ncbi:MAG: M20 family peptidase [Cellvibrionaceae bacterium]|nr:M20 family peptidase [Cellvibrionaceae bacterium]